MDLPSGVVGEGVRCARAAWSPKEVYYQPRERRSFRKFLPASQVRVPSSVKAHCKASRLLIEQGQKGRQSLRNQKAKKVSHHGLESFGCPSAPTALRTLPLRLSQPSSQENALTANTPPADSATIKDE